MHCRHTINVILPACKVRCKYTTVTVDRTSTRQQVGHIQLDSNDYEQVNNLLDTLFVGPNYRAVCSWPAENSGSNPAEGMDVSCECCALSDSCFCDELITRPGEYYRLWCAVLCNQETS